MFDHPAALLRPLAQTKTLDSWDNKYTVNGGVQVKLELFNCVSVGHCKTGIHICGQHFQPVSKILNAL
ncbi:hypothetical protein IGI04_029936 [Brassica rapa subsp. trilocularis]|uniref:Uncharacterized protein n=1 Tax=Brassica rapa subsp. trilocularis TaxID=1813537 RepID=A0ABQ7LP87_BRACM|nr:hypothetical protein IGI04_029936 [Brassica rapa subsp. trilocularis]